MELLQALDARGARGIELDRLKAEMGVDRAPGGTSALDSRAS